MRKLIVSGTVIVLLLLSVIPAFADAAVWPEEPADYYVYVATPDGGLNLRYGPGTEYERVIDYRIPDGEKLYIRAKSGNWGFTEYDGYYGWVALKQTSDKPPVIQEEKPVVTQKTTVVENKTEKVEETTNVTIKPVEEITDAVEGVEEETRSVSSTYILMGVIIVLVVVIAVLIIVIVNNKQKQSMNF